MLPYRRFFPSSILCCFCLLLCCRTTALAQSTEQTWEVLQQWQAGKTVTSEAITAYGGLDPCFAAVPIPNDVWARMQGKSYKKNPYIGRDDLRYVKVLHWDYDEQNHVGELVCNRRIANTLVTIFRQLYEAHYPIQQMLLPDVYDADDERQMRANNTSCFCYRAVAGSKTLSAHARGMAIDLNPLYNPYYKDRPNGTRYVQPATAKSYCDRTQTFPYKIDTHDLAYRLFTQHGFRWGGSWIHSKDFQHFEYSH